MRVHDFSLKTINGTETPLSDYSGKVLLLVNVASACGFTRQYEGLQALYERYADQGLVIMGIPSNDFGAQEPGTEEEIKTFCETKYSVTFPLFSKVAVKNTPHSLYAHLQEEKGPVKWNFTKFLVGKDGIVLSQFQSDVEPQSKELTQAIEEALS